MTDDQAIALSCVPSLSRVGLTDRLRNDDPELLDLAARHLDAGRRARIRAEAEGLRPLVWHASDFPPLLRATPDCPPVLWVRGHVDALGGPCLAIVGSRAATVVGCEIAATMARELAAAGAVVVSGLARGVDSAAHRGALLAGRTVAVLGSGPDRVYPREHGALAIEIAQTGAVISEYPPGTPPLPFHFPQRNRLISGLSRAVVVVEAAENSGSLITAACAVEQGREVMVVPGNVLSGRNRGGHAMLRDGARLVESAADVLAELGLEPAGVQAPMAHTGVDSLLAAMDVGEPYDLDQLTAMLGLPGPAVLARLLELELRGDVHRAGGGRFIRS